MIEEKLQQAPHANPCNLNGAALASATRAAAAIDVWMRLPGPADAATAGQWSGPAAFARFDSSAVPADALDPDNAGKILFDQASGLVEKQEEVFALRRAAAKKDADPRAAQFAEEARHAHERLARGTAGEPVGAHRDIIDDRLLAVPRKWRDRVGSAVRRFRPGCRAFYRPPSPHPIWILWEKASERNSDLLARVFLEPHQPTIWR